MNFNVFHFQNASSKSLVKPVCSMQNIAPFTAFDLVLFAL